MTGISGHTQEVYDHGGRNGLYGNDVTIKISGQRRYDCLGDVSRNYSKWNVEDNDWSIVRSDRRPRGLVYETEVSEKKKPMETSDLMETIRLTIDETSKIMKKVNQEQERKINLVRMYGINSEDN